MQKLLFAAVAAFGLAGAAQAALPVYPNPGVVNPADYSFTAAATGDVLAYFAGSTASYTSKLRLEVNGVDTGIEGLENHSTALGTALNFGTVNAGDVLVFKLHVLSTGNYFYSQRSLNPDGITHVYSTAYAGGDSGIPAGTFVAFEDLLNGGDANYNDHKFVFTNVAGGQTPGVPEPASWAMMIAGFGLVGYASRYQRKAAVRA